MSIPIRKWPGYQTWNGSGVTIGDGIAEFLDWLKREKNIDPDTIRMPARAFLKFAVLEAKVSPWMLQEHRRITLNSAWGRVEIVAAKTPNDKLLFMRQGVIIGVGEDFNF